MRMTALESESETAICFGAPQGAALSGCGEEDAEWDPSGRFLPRPPLIRWGHGANEEGYGGRCPLRHRVLRTEGPPAGEGRGNQGMPKPTTTVPPK
jgi:hypothetical protein